MFMVFVIFFYRFSIRNVNKVAPGAAPGAGDRR